MNRTSVSVVIPCFNEEANLRETHHRVTEAISRAGIQYEIVYVDDGSRDLTAELLRQLQADDEHVRVVYLSRNFGHQFAVSAGLAHASGGATVIMDADLQDPPEVMLDMIRLWEDGYDVVYGVRTDREGETRFKLLTARLFYRLIRWLSETEIPLDTGDFRLMGLPYRRAPRFAGQTKYPLSKMVRFAFDGIVSFSVKPLRLSTLMGFVSAGLALFAILYALAMRLFTQRWVTGWTALIIAILFLGGAQLISLGIIGEYVGRLYGEAKRRPLYLVRETLGIERAAPATATASASVELAAQSRAARDRRTSRE